ncbi:cysteine hydrolase family protein [Thermostichus vulcanus]|uniref:Isochorismatase family protein n=1 Tax=Thermostichus vulcanus str. 'Rupite' TaxID=2813851 RepID=A0ABT0CEA9_THEVL|nr:isochorismatase family protein [Thermostichus vulcanus]MCJ2544115.1 isochorismatase family protein [Thermostichus vulcanus str. 'Rupite']
MYPWEGVIPESDVSSFRNAFNGSERPLEAGTKPALVIIDMTMAFIDSRYPTGWSETGYPAVEANRKLLVAAREIGIPVIYTKAYPDPNHKPTPLERGRWKTGKRPPVQSDLPPGDVIPDPITPIEGEVIIDKGSKPSGFFGTPLASYLTYYGVDTVIVTGMTTSGCVRATVLDAFQNNYYVLIPHEACADRSQLSHKVNLFDMHMKYADVISVDTTVDYLQQLSGKVKELASV